MTRRTDEVEAYFNDYFDTHPNYDPRLFDDMFDIFITTGIENIVTPVNELDPDENKFEYAIERYLNLYQPPEDVAPIGGVGDIANILQSFGMDIDADALFRGGQFGCAFGGVKFIKEVDNEDFYIPKSSYCGLLCLEKMIPGLEISRVGKKEMGMTLSAFRSMIKVLFTGEDVGGKFPELAEQFYKFHNALDIDDDDQDYGEYMPKFYRIAYKNADKTSYEYTPINRESGKKCPFSILLVKHRKYEGFHAILIKNEFLIKKRVDDMVSTKYINPAEWNKKIEFYEERTLGPEMIRAQRFRPKKIHNFIAVWDIETCSIKNEKGGEQLVPIAVGWAIVDLRKYPDSVPVNIEFEYVGCIDNFLVNMVEEFKRVAVNDDGSVDDEIYCFAHNSGGFDVHYVMASKIVKLSDDISTGGKVKSITVELNNGGPKMIFRDSILFTEMDLKKSCEKYKVKNSKITFDIKGKTREWYLENYQPYVDGETRLIAPENDWAQYLAYDVKPLAEIVYQINKLIGDTFSIPITSVLGNPGLAGQLIIKNCSHWRNVYVAKNLVTKKFIRAAVHGGRVIHHKQCFKGDYDKVVGEDGKVNYNVREGMISLDGNSLYPSAMYYGLYPIGLPLVFNECTLGDFREWKRNGYLFIAEVEFSTGNQRYPIHPFKEESGMLTYKVGDNIVDVYSSVELEDMVHDGYVIHSVKRAIVWKKCANIFQGLIKSMYDWRMTLKSAKDSREQIIKLIMNAMYGKMLEMIRSTVSYSTDETCGGIPLPNGQYRLREHMENPKSTTPTQLGVFILSYARRLMNNIIRKVRPENVYYGDTDSIYITLNSFKNSGIKETIDLCGVKNDYGEGSVILDAIFLDFKRYCLKIKKDDGTIEVKIKFNGISFKSKDSGGNMWIRDWYSKNVSGVETDECERVFKFFQWFRENPGIANDITACVEYWDRKVGVGSVIYNREMKFQVNPEKRGFWIENDWYPFGIKLFEQPAKINCEEIPLIRTTISRKRNAYSFGVNGFYASLPPVFKQLSPGAVVPIKIDDSLFLDTPGFYATIEKKLFMRDRIHGKLKTFTIDKYGISKEIEPQVAVLLIIGVSSEYCSPTFDDDAHCNTYMKNVSCAVASKNSTKKIEVELDEEDLEINPWPVEDNYDDWDDVDL